MVEYVPLAVYLHDGAVVVAPGEVNPVVHYEPPVLKGTCGGLGCGIGKAAAPLRGIYHVVGVPYLAGGGCLKEALFLLVKAPLLCGLAGDEILYAGAVYDLVHIVGIHLSHEGALKSAVDVCPAVVIHQHSRVDEPAVAAYLIGDGVLVFIQQLKGSFGSVADGNTAPCIDDVGKQVVPAVLALHHVRGIELGVVAVPVDIRLVVGIVTGVEDMSVADPVVKVIHGSGPAFELEIAEFISPCTVVGAVDVYSVAENSRLAVGNVFPQRKIWIHSVPPVRSKMQDFGMMTKQLVFLCKQQPEIKSHGLWQLLAVNAYFTSFVLDPPISMLKSTQIQGSYAAFFAVFFAAAAFVPLSSFLASIMPLSICGSLNCALLLE